MIYYKLLKYPSKSTTNNKKNKRNY